MRSTSTYLQHLRKRYLTDAAFPTGTTHSGYIIRTSALRRARAFPHIFLPSSHSVLRQYDVSLNLPASEWYISLLLLRVAVLAGNVAHCAKQNSFSTSSTRSRSRTNSASRTFVESSTPSRMTPPYTFRSYRAWDSAGGRLGNSHRDRKRVTENFTIAVGNCCPGSGWW